MDKAFLRVIFTGIITVDVQNIFNVRVGGYEKPRCSFRGAACKFSGVMRS